jgi:putative peptidoglycan lipid II flippase
MIVFRVLNGPGEPGLHLSLAEQLTLGIGATVGVAAFVGVPAIALHRTGFRLRPRLDRRDPAVSRLLRLSGWAVFQHSMIGVLLVSAIVMGNRVEGGFIAYQVAWIFFLAPYAVLAQPVHTAVLPELTAQEATGDREAFASSLRWALGAMATIVVPVSLAMMSLALPGMRVFAFGEAARGDGVALLAAGVASLAAGLFFYSAFLLLARAYYALGDSRTPALAALGSAVVGAATMLVVGQAVHGTAVVAALGVGHGVAYLVGATVLAVGLSRHTGKVLVPWGVMTRVLAVASPLAAAAWWVADRIAPHTRVEALALLATVGVVAGTAYLGAMRALGAAVMLRRRKRPLGDRPVSAQVEAEVDAAEVDA